MALQQPGVLRFADCVLEPAEQRLLVQGQKVTLTPKVFETLVLLASRAGHVVSKDELIAALWPRGFVHESNLTKHIWLIRKALLEDADRVFIETVPKIGYRFVAPLLDQSGPISPSTQADVEKQIPRPVLTRPEEDVIESQVPRTRWHGWLAAVVLGVVLLGIAALFLTHRFRTSATPAVNASSVSDANGIAIIGFSNLSQNPKDAWLGPALAQMLATEVSAGGKLHVISSELTYSARTGVSAPAAGGYAPESLATLGHRTGAHYVLSGSYLVSGDEAGEPQLRIDLELQQTDRARAVSMFSSSGAVTSLPQMITQAGAELRKSFAIPAMGGAQLKLLSNYNPPTVDVARHVGFALDAFERSDPARARDELLQAIAQAPAYAPAYTSLARAWSALGYRSRALAAIAQAAAHAADLPPEQRLQIQAQQASLAADWTGAMQAYRALIALRPADPAYQFGLLDTQLAAGKPDLAEATLIRLRQRAGAAFDPHLELAAAAIASARENPAGELAHARAALQLAQTRGETGLIARAELELGRASDDATAEPLFRHAITAFRSVDNPHGQALSYQNLGNALLGQNQTQSAREAYQQAMAIYQRIGDLNGQSAIYDDLTRLLWAAGDRDGAETAIREALRIARETEDTTRQAWSLTGLATILSDESASDAVEAMYRQALELDQRAGVHAHHAFVQSTLADFLRQRGDLAQAQATCKQAQAEATALVATALQRSVDFGCALIALDQGRVTDALTAAKDVLHRAQAAQDTFTAANAQLLMGQIELGNGQFHDARGQLLDSLRGWKTVEEAAGEATAESQLGLCAAALGDSSGRNQAIARANVLRQRINQRLEVLPVDIALAQLRGDAGDRTQALAALNALAVDASRRHWPGLALEAQLAQLTLLARDGDPQAQALRTSISAQARAQGFGWVLTRLNALHVGARAAPVRSASALQ